jgi:group I intron endonuclease
MDCIGIIYLITNKVNRKRYVGQTRNFGIRKGKKIKIGIKGRWEQHCWKSKNNQDDCPAISRAIRKYGSENFIIEELYRCPIEELNEAEIYYIDLYETYEKGYNCTVGGDFPNFNEEQRIRINKKISKKNKEHWKTRDRDVISKKISQNTRDAMWTEEVRSKLLDSVKSKKTDLPHNIYERKQKGILTGYEVKIKIRGTLYRGWFSSKSVPLEENFKNAVKYLNKIKRNNL